MLEKGALTDVFVLDVSRLLPGPFCSMILADHGARVISIEDKRFQADALFIPSINRNKEHMSLNLKTPAGLTIFKQLAQKADVLIEGFRPGVSRRLGIDYETMRAINPRIIYCSITGYGQTGPKRDQAGHDVNYLSLSGVLDLIGDKERPPSIPGVQFADIAGGSMNAVIGILLALLAREKTGEGQYIDIAMTDGMVNFLAFPMFFRDGAGKAPERSDHILSHRYAFYNTYETMDNRYLAIGALENRFWQRLCDYLAIPEYGKLQYDEEQRETIIECLRQKIKAHSLAYWEEELAKIDVCCEPVRTLDEVIASPLTKAREMIQTGTLKNGQKVMMPGIAVKLSQTPGTLRTSPVSFGENTRAILTELGYPDDEIDAFGAEDVF